MGNSLIYICLDSIGVTPLHPKRIPVGKPVVHGRRAPIFILNVDLSGRSTSNSPLTPICNPLALAVSMVIVAIITAAITIELHIVHLIIIYRRGIDQIQFPCAVEVRIKERVIPSVRRFRIPVIPIIVINIAARRKSEQQAYNRQ